MMLLYENSPFGVRHIFHVASLVDCSQLAETYKLLALHSKPMLYVHMCPVMFQYKSWNSGNWAKPAIDLQTTGNFCLQLDALSNLTSHLVAMSISASSTPALSQLQMSSAIREQSTFFREVAAEKGPIQLPKLVSKILRGARHTEPHDTASVVNAIDDDDAFICHRLNADGFIVLCAFFMNAEDCSAQHRGFRLLAVRSTAY